MTAEGNADLSQIQCSIASLWRYPVKGLAGQAIETVTVEKEGCFPFDRVYAIENGPTQFDSNDPKHLPKVNFLNLMRDERLALLAIDFDETSQILTILRQDKQVARGDLSTPLGRNMVEQFFAAFMSNELKGPPRIQRAENHHFTDMPERLVHIINLSSVTALGQMMNEPIDENRFRANIHLKGLEPWMETKWVGRILKTDDVEIEIVSPTSRCAAINVDLKTANRGRSLAGALNQQFGNDNFGVYGRIVSAGTLSQGASVSL